MLVYEYLCASTEIKEKDHILTRLFQEVTKVGDFEEQRWEEFFFLEEIDPFAPDLQ